MGNLHGCGAGDKYGEEPFYLIACPKSDLEQDEKQIIKDADTMANVELTKKINDAIPVARAYDFFDKFRELVNLKTKFQQIKQKEYSKCVN